MNRRAILFRVGGKVGITGRFGDDRAGMFAEWRKFVELLLRCSIIAAATTTGATAATPWRTAAAAVSR